MTRSQEDKLDKVLDLTAKHAVTLEHITGRLAAVAETQAEHEVKIIRLETQRDERWRRWGLGLAGISALCAVLTALSRLVP